MNESLTLDWVPSSCTLPTAERPLRTAEFEAVFTDHVTAIDDDHPDRLVLSLTASPEIAAQVADLASRETGCCGFLRFTLELSDGQLSTTITASEPHRDVLAALTARARELSGISA
jgi:hypothetical protein